MTKNERHELVCEEARVAIVVRVFAETVGGVRERDDHVRDLEAVDEVVEDRAERGETQVVVRVVNDEQRVPARRAEPRGEVDPEMLAASERLRFDGELVEPAGRGSRIAVAP